MKNLNNYIVEHLEYSTFPITERLHITKKTNIYKYFPKTKEELREILEERLAEDKDADLNDIDVSKITDMGKINSYGLSYGLFESLDPHNIKLDKWDVSNVTDMKWMFYDCVDFNSDLSNWNVSNVTDMCFMFYDCENFNTDLSNWDVSNVRSMKAMFFMCKNFEGKGLEKWNISKVINMNYMFDKCTSLQNKPIWYKE